MSIFGAPGWNRTTTPCLQNRTSTTKDTRAKNLVEVTGIEPVSSEERRIYNPLPYHYGGTSKILKGLHGARRWGIHSQLLSFGSLSANNTFQTPTGPTLLIVRHILSVKPGKSLPGRFPSTHLTRCCLSILAPRTGIEPA